MSALQTTTSGTEGTSGSFKKRHSYYFRCSACESTYRFDKKPGGWVRLALRHRSPLQTSGDGEGIQLKG